MSGVPNPSPQRFAKMLLLTQDNINKRDDLDFYGASVAVPEIAMLGNALDEIDSLGSTAQAKVRGLPYLDDSLVASTIHELLVGAAFVRRGRTVEMLPENRATKMPDLALHGFDVPIDIECKRRQGLSDYELYVAAHVERLYAEVCETLLRRGLHVLIMASFTSEIAAVAPEEFRRDTLALLSTETLDGARQVTDWGILECQVLPYTLDVTRSRLYSPIYLEHVFGWTSPATDWDGLICEVDAPDRVIMTRCKNPRGLKWVSLSAAATTKKARGMTTLWRRAAQQIRSGAMGLIYIAYSEGNRSVIADARTEHIKGAIHDWTPRWSVQIPMTVIGRLYPSPLGVGVPDLIESSCGVTIDGDEAWLGMFPINVFTRRG